MNEGIGAGRRAPWGLGRAGAALAAVVLLAAGCGGGGSHGAGPSQGPLQQLSSFAQCMRGHGEPDYPDPTLSGQGTSGSPKGAGINPGSPQFQAAVAACQHVLPAGAHVSVGTASGTRQS